MLVGAAIALGAFVLAQAQIFEPEAAPPTGATEAGDAVRGAVVFEETCASCHGSGGVGGSPGPRLVGSNLEADLIAATIEQGVGVMPPALVSGQAEADVVAFVVSIAAQ